MSILSDAGLDLIFRKARSPGHWQDRPVGEVMLQAIYDLAKLGPTEAGQSPMRVVFVVTPEAKRQLQPCLANRDVESTMSAPATAIVACDARDAGPVADAARRAATLQGAYLIVAARALGLDCGPVFAFDRARLDAAFFPQGGARSKFLVNIGYGPPETSPPRDPGPSFDEACRIV